MKNKKGFTIVELLAVIVILSIILVIAVPQIMNTIKLARLKSMEGSAKLIATNAEDDYYSKKLANRKYNAASIACTDVAKLSKDYASCIITYDSNGSATVKLKGASGGKFDGIKCKGTKDNMSCSDAVVPLPGYSAAVELLMSKYNNGTNSEGLIKVEHDTNVIPNATAVEYRYRGENPNNYALFNCIDNENPTSSTCEVWRIVGLFDGRVKLVRKDSIGSFSWDTSDSSINSGQGVNEWSKSKLMQELNGDYLNSSLSENTNWYNGRNNKKEGVFNKDFVLKQEAQGLIGDATWYLGGVPYDSIVTLADAYIQERGEQGKMCTQGTTYCNDTVTRTYTWTGKVGLIYSSDYGYASGNSNCATNISLDGFSCDTNWMTSYHWAITSAPGSINACIVWLADSAGVNNNITHTTYGVHPSVYLISGVQMKGSGTMSDPYVFAD